MTNWLVIMFLLVVGNSVIYYTYLWQLKEYRWDRMKDFLRSKSGRTRVWPWYYWVRLALVVFTGFTIGVNSAWNESGGMIWLYNVLFFSWILDLGDALWRIVKHKYVRPDKTLKALLIMGGSVFLVVGAAAILGYGKEKGDLIWTINVIMLLIPWLTTLAVAMFYPITIWMKNRVLNKAAKKLLLRPELKVVGITGSYGKSSTKEFLAQILQNKYNVLATPGNTNTEVGVAGVVLKDLKPDHQVFIVEMGAYRPGEIKKICDLVRPRIGIVTAAKDAHLALFGSLENLKKTKFELISSLPETGTAIFNLDNDGAAELSERASKLKIKTIGCSTLKENGSKRATFQAELIEVREENVVFVVEGVNFSANVFGRQNIPNLLTAIAAARELGMNLQEIAEAVQKIKISRKTMNLKKASDKLWIIDDTYNANPDGVQAALNYLSIFENRKKIIVFPGMLELGENSDKEHKKVAQRIVEVCDLAIFTSKDFEKPIKEGLGQNYSTGKHLFIVDNQGEIENRIRNLSEQNLTVALFISRGSDEVIKKLMKM